MDQIGLERRQKMPKLTDTLNVVIHNAIREYTVTVPIANILQFVYDTNRSELRKTIDHLQNVSREIKPENLEFIVLQLSKIRTEAKIITDLLTGTDGHIFNCFIDEGP